MADEDELPHRRGDEDENRQEGDELDGGLTALTGAATGSDLSRSRDRSAAVRPVCAAPRDTGGRAGCGHARRLLRIASRNQARTSREARGTVTRVQQQARASTPTARAPERDARRALWRDPRTPRQRRHPCTGGALASC